MQESTSRFVIAQDFVGLFNSNLATTRIWSFDEEVSQE
jgi:hypothetical protein